jgi:Fe-S-cluster-containing hydrogenase component 2
MAFPPLFKVEVDREKCSGCLRCTLECPFEVHNYEKEKYEKFIAEKGANLSQEEKKEQRKYFIKRKEENCVACQRCVFTCPEKAIIIQQRTPSFSKKKAFSAGLLSPFQGT